MNFIFNLPIFSKIKKKTNNLTKLYHFLSRKYFIFYIYSACDL